MPGLVLTGAAPCSCIMAEPVDHRIDWDRRNRTAVAEAVLCDGKSVNQIADICSAAIERNSPLLLTRLEHDKHTALSALGVQLDYDPLSRTGIIGALSSAEGGSVAIVCAGTSDLPVAAEARRTLAFHGIDATMIVDVGVAGIWRLLDNIEVIERHSVVIAVAGMEGALFSVLAGLTSRPVIAVPTSVGYGVSAGGHNALNSALGTCAPGVVVVNIDNGFGAAAAAIKIIRARPVV